jgi:hypothetical protein
LTNIALAVALAAVIGLASPADAFTHVTTVPLGPAAHDIKVVGTRAYVATDAGMTILDVGNPAAPFVLGTFSKGTSSSCQGIDVGIHVYLACQEDGVLVVDASNPAAPALVGSLRLPGGLTWDVAAKGNVLYAVTFGGELFVIGVADPRRPTRIAVRGLLAWSSASHDQMQTAKLRNHAAAGSAKATSVSVAGDLLVTNDWNYGRMYAYDVRVPTNPIFKGTHYVPFVLSVDADPDPSTGHVYMLGAYGRFSGIYTLPIRLLNPLVPTRYTTCSECKFLRSRNNIDQGGLARSPGGQHVYYMGGRGEFHSLAVSPPGTLVEAAFTNFGPSGLGLAETMGAATVGDHVYVTAGDQGVRVYALPGASR